MRGTDIVILHEAMHADARPDDLDALVQATEIEASLVGQGCDVTTIATGLDLSSTLEKIEELRSDCVVNLVESLRGNGRLITLVPALLSAADIPYTGSDESALLLSSQKLLAKRWMFLHGIPTPRWFVPGAESVRDTRPWIIKSVWEHASLGIDDDAIVRGAAAIVSRLEHSRLAHGGEWFAERYIDGREFNISVIEVNGAPRVLPIAEIEFRDFPADKPRIVGYAAKWDVSAQEYKDTFRTFPKLSPVLGQRLETLTLQCWRVFGLRGYARVDFRVDKQGVPWVLEVNANPCLSRDAGFAAALTEAGMDYDAGTRAIVETALKRSRSDVNAVPLS